MKGLPVSACTLHPLRNWVCRRTLATVFRAKVTIQQGTRSQSTVLQSDSSVGEDRAVNSRVTRGITFSVALAGKSVISVKLKSESSYCSLKSYCSDGLNRSCVFSFSSSVESGLSFKAGPPTCGLFLN